ncbi:DUF2332 domain-containing protein [Phenylobacterium sp.]|uniref:DUF2332 domain-containing protein n=1 Tax=Phenylobacterium sp. TaxID=1871053 RepID=UPI002733C80B|nr:DUF2332 family protein [Phenylobacterium sp.]MDP3632579.1 DUF2332 family protein [Phenylobacterium sp.]MDP3869033.1 DUF2332 family protein [Phenylobacterium sp.]
MDNPDLARAFLAQANSCRVLGSPFHGDLLTLAADDLQAGGPVTALLAPWATTDYRKLVGDAVCLRLLGSLHDLVLSGDDPALAATYPQPGRDADPAVAWIAARSAIIRHEDRLAAFMTHEPQTNEVRRSACLAPGFLTIAAETGLPIRAFEVAASAGLNLNWERFRYRFGDIAWGDPAARVTMDTEWTGSAPAVDARVEVIERAACDRRPGDLTDPVQRRRLLAYIWPDQFERLDRIRAAIDLALSLGVNVEAADAVTWSARVAAPQAGAVTVLYHSVFWQYMPPESQAALAQVIADHGAQATAGGPFAWLRMEPPPERLSGMEVRLTLWPSGEDRVLAQVHPHGAWVKWLN